VDERLKGAPLSRTLCSAERGDATLLVQTRIEERYL
jgi:hypothetical protein